MNTTRARQLTISCPHFCPKMISLIRHRLHGNNSVKNENYNGRPIKIRILKLQSYHVIKELKYSIIQSAKCCRFFVWLFVVSIHVVLDNPFLGLNFHENKKWANNFIAHSLHTKLSFNLQHVSFLYKIIQNYSFPTFTVSSTISSTLHCRGFKLCVSLGLPKSWNYKKRKCLCMIDYIYIILD